MRCGPLLGVLAVMSQVVSEVIRVLGRRLHLFLTDTSNIEEDKDSLMTCGALMDLRPKSHRRRDTVGHSFAGGCAEVPVGSHWPTNLR
jgi:hypothetical protein